NAAITGSNSRDLCFRRLDPYHGAPHPQFTLSSGLPKSQISKRPFWTNIAVAKMDTSPQTPLAFPRGAPDLLKGRAFSRSSLLALGEGGTKRRSGRYTR